VIGFSEIMFLLMTFGLPSAFFLLGLVWAYSRSEQNQEGPCLTFLTTIAGGVCFGVVGLVVALMLFPLFEGMFRSLL